MKLQSLILAMAILVAPIAMTSEAQAKTTKLPAYTEAFAQYNGTLQEALENRSTTKSFSKKALSDKDVSGILWSAYGVNREDNGRTVAGFKTIELYVANSKGVWTYDAEAHALNRVTSKNILSTVAGNPSLVLAYVVDRNKFGKFPAVVSPMEAGLMAHSAGLYASMADLGAFIVNWNDNFAKGLNLADGKELLILQTFGTK